MGFGVAALGRGQRTAKVVRQSGQQEGGPLREDPGGLPVEVWASAGQHDQDWSSCSGIGLWAQGEDRKLR